jgi:hypothetical protein
VVDSGHTGRVHARCGHQCRRAGGKPGQARSPPAAIHAYTQALSIRPDYPTALASRAYDWMAANSPEPSSFITSASTKKAYESAIDDLSEAMRSNKDDYLTVLNLGAAYFHVRNYAKSAQLSQQAIQINPRPPLPWANLGLAHLAQGRTSQALKEYHQAIHRIIARPHPVEHQELFSSTLTELEILAAQQPHKLAIVRKVEGELIASESARKHPHEQPANQAIILAPSLKVHGPALQLSYINLNMPKGARMAEIGYVRPRGANYWIQATGLTRFQPNPAPLSGYAPIRLVDQSCQPPSEYRVDIYTGTHRLASVTAPAQPPAETLLPYVDSVSSIALCRLAGGWMSVKGTIELTSPDQRRQISIGVLPLTRPDLRAGEASLVSGVLRRLAHRLSPHARVIKNRSIAAARDVPATEFRLPGHMQGIVCASVVNGGTGRILRTLVATYPAAADRAVKHDLLWVDKARPCGSSI